MCYRLDSSYVSQWPRNTGRQRAVHRSGSCRRRCAINIITGPLVVDKTRVEREVQWYAHVVHWQKLNCRMVHLRRRWWSSIVGTVVQVSDRFTYRGSDVELTLAFTGALVSHPHWDNLTERGVITIYPEEKIRVYTTLILLYGCEARTILKEDDRRLEAFHMKCQRRILGIKRSDFKTYDYSSCRLATWFLDICDTIVYRQHILSGALGTSRRTRPRTSPSKYASMPAQKWSQFPNEGVHVVARAITDWSSWKMITDSMLSSSVI